MKKIFLSLLLLIGINICFSFGSFESLLSGTTTSINGYTNISNVNTIKLSVSSSDFGNIYCLSGTLNSIVNSNCNGSSTTNGCNILFGVASSSRGYSSWGYNFQLNGDLLDIGGKIFGCFTLQNVPSGVTYIALTNNSSSSYNHDFTYDIMKYTPDSSGGGSSSCDYSEYETQINILSGNLLNCQNDLNTCQNSSSCDYSGYILESEVTQNYCELTYNLISPSDCPSSGGSGDINWSSFFVNSRQVQGASNVYLFLPDFLNWDYTYIDNGSTLEINVENQGDQDYINDILTIQSYHPSSEDFTQSFTGTLTLLMPYIIICLFIIFLWKLIRKIFK